MKCDLCGEEITSTKQMYREVAGWERPGRGPSGSSGSSLVARKPTGRIACNLCITRLVYGIPQEQEAMEL